MKGAVGRVVLTVVGWIVLLAGVAAMVLPGPGLLLMFFGLAILSQQYDWAERLLEPVRLRALRGAAEGVETWPRIIASTLGAVTIGAFGVLWIVSPPAPEWWPLAAGWWLVGGSWAGITLVLSSLMALALVIYSYRRFHDKPEARAALDGQIEEAVEDAAEERERLRHRMDERRHHRDDDEG